MSNSYDSSNIEYLTDIDHIRLRPSMYIGELNDPRHLFVEAIDNSIDEVLSGYCNKIIVKVDKINDLYEYSVEDYGRGIPIGTKIDPSNSDNQVSTLEVITRYAKSGGKFNNDSYKIRSGLHGVGLCAIISLSKHAEISTQRVNDKGKSIYNTVEYYQDDLTDFIIDEKDCNEHSYTKKVASTTYMNFYDDSDVGYDHVGTKVTFTPDDSIFKINKIPIDFIINKCKICNAQYGNVIHLIVEDKEVDVTAEFTDLIYRPEENTSKYVEHLFEVGQLGNSAKIFIEYNSGQKYSMKSYCNLVETYDGGTHYKELIKSIEKVWSEFLSVESEVKFHKDDCRLGLYGVISISISDPQFSSQTKEKLTVDAEYLRPIFDDFENQFRQWLIDNEELRHALIKRFEIYRNEKDKMSVTKDIMKLVKINDMSKNTTNTIKRKSVVPKLVECSQTKRDNTEVYFVEGDSAGGVASRARNSKLQAVLPLRGKIKNVTNMDIKSALKSQEVLSIVNTAGCGVGDDCNPDNSRYDRYIVNSDSDPDGCFEYSTVIKSLDGNSYKIGELVDKGIDHLWVYSKDENGNMVPGYAHHPRITRYVDKLIELEFSNGYKVRCTDNHPFLLKSGEYKRADELTSLDSISSLYFDYNPRVPRDYLRYYDDINDSWNLVHTHINYLVHRDEYDKVQDNLVKNGKDRYESAVSHHKDHNMYNNIPDNLEWMNSKERGSYHLTEYNKSIKHRESASAIGKITGPVSITKYNKSEKHKNTVRQMNTDEEVKELQKKGRILKLVKYMLHNSIEITENNYNKVLRERNISATRWSKSIEYFSSIDEMIELASKREYEDIGLADYSHNGTYKIQTRILNIINNAKIAYGEINETTYEKSRTAKSDPKWSSITRYFESYDEALERASLVNHRIKSSKVIYLDEKVPVYDITVDKYHNFMIETSDDHMEGVIVHNCHITSLVLSVFINILPELVKQGYVYVALPPLYGYMSKGKYYYTDDMKTIPEELRKTKSFTRFKGLGEMDDDQYEETCMNPETRKIVQVTYPDDLEKFNRILGSSIGRKELLSELGLLVNITNNEDSKE